MNKALIKKLSYRILLIFCISIVSLAIISYPVMIIDMVKSASKSGSGHAAIVTKGRGMSQFGLLDINLDAISLNDSTGSLTFNVSGNYVCKKDCSPNEIIMFYSLNSDPIKSFPPSQSVRINAVNRSIDTNISLPAKGSIGGFPFDQYNLELGIAILKEDSFFQPLNATEIHNQLTLIAESHVPRMDFSSIDNLHLQENPNLRGENLIEVTFNFNRPFYFDILVLMVVTLALLGSLFAVIVKEFKDILPTTGVVVLGIWAIRTLLEGTIAVDFTVLDLILEASIGVLLLIIAIKGRNS
jgi:hypothetical protein